MIETQTTPRLTKVDEAVLLNPPKSPLLEHMTLEPPWIQTMTGREVGGMGVLEWGVRMFKLRQSSPDAT